MNNEISDLGQPLQAVQELAASAAQFSQAAPGLLTDQLAVCLAADLALAWQRSQAVQADSPDPLQRVNQLSPFLGPLRRGDHAAQRLQIRREVLSLAAQKHQDHLAGQKNKYDQFLHPRPRDGGFSKETIEKIAHELNLF